MSTKTRTRTSLAGLLVTLLTMIGIVALAERADATDGNVTGQSYCIDATHWGVTWTWHATNVPGDVEGDVKAITTSAGTLDKNPGAGVMAGGQVILSAWTSHAGNWPGVPVHHGNYTEAFSTVGIPTSTGSVTTMVQYDYDNGHSGDPTGEVGRPDDCTPTETPSPTPTPSETPTPSDTPTPTPTEPPTAPPTSTPPTVPPTLVPPTNTVPPEPTPPPAKPPTRVRSHCLGNALVITREHYVDGDWETTETSSIEGAVRCETPPGQPPVEEEGF